MYRHRPHQFKGVSANKKKQFGPVDPPFIENYPTRLNFYTNAPRAEISLEDFEEWAISRLKVLAEIENCAYRSMTSHEISARIMSIAGKWLPLHANTSSPHGSADQKLRLERMKDHYSHYILRLAFSATEETRKRLARLESTLFRLRCIEDDSKEHKLFLDGLCLQWQAIPDSDFEELEPELCDYAPNPSRFETCRSDWFQVDFEMVPELIENRKVILRKGKAYMHRNEQSILIHSAFQANLEEGLEAASKALPRLDEDDRLTPILHHLATNLEAPSANYNFVEGSSVAVSAECIDGLAQHFPPCMRNLNMQLRKNAHLKHYARLQYTLFLKGAGLALDQCILFWRQAFRKTSEEVFKKEYLYNIRHAYGDVGGDANRRGLGYAPYSCQKILTEHPPGPGEAHGCPYRHFDTENLSNLLLQYGVSDGSILKAVRGDVQNRKYHIACNRVFDHIHDDGIRRLKSAGLWKAEEETVLIHPNDWFNRSVMIRSQG